MSFKNKKINLVFFALICFTILLSFSFACATEDNVTCDTLSVDMNNSVNEMSYISIDDSQNSNSFYSSIDDIDTAKCICVDEKETKNLIAAPYSTSDSIEKTQNNLRSPTTPFVIESNGHSFATLSDALTNCSDGDTITIKEGTYSGAGNIGVEINKNVVISAASGCNVVFDARGVDSNILTIAANNKVALVNLAFTGVKNTNTRFGAVVSHGNLSVKGCTFKFNTVLVKGAGGTNGAAAIFSDGIGLSISDSSFVNNTASPVNITAHINTGGVAAVASWASSGVSIANCSFINNTARYGSAVEFEGLNQKAAAVVDCSFINNTGYIGAGININDACVYVNITGSTFVSNKVKGPQGAPTTGAMGGAICAGNIPVTVEVSKCIFEKNKDDGSAGSSGGAIRLANNVSGIIRNCSFVANSGRYGSAISIGTMYNDTASLIVDNCIFEGNTAATAGTVEIGKGISAVINDSIFRGNVAGVEDSRNIYKGGSESVEISNTRFDTVISFASDVSDDIVYGNVKTVRVYVDDGTGNLNGDKSVVLSYDGIDLDPASVVVLNDGKMGVDINLPILDVGEHRLAVVSLNSNGNTSAIENVKSSFNVIKADVNIGINEDSVIYPNEGNIKITSNVDGYYTVIINEVESIVKLINGSANLKVPILNVGIYDVIVAFDGNDNYNAKSITFPGAYVVTKSNVTLTILVSDIHVGDEEVIVVNVPNDATGTINITVNNAQYNNIEIVNGKVSLLLNDLSSGKYDIKAIYNGNDNYLPSNVTNTTFMVYKNNITFAIEDKLINHGETAIYEIILSSDVTGNITIKIGNKTFNGTLTGGKTTIDVTGFSVGNYTVVAIYSGDDKYNSANSNTAKLNIAKYDMELDVSIKDGVYGDNATVTVSVTDDATGNITIKINNKSIIKGIVNGKVVFNISKLAAGSYDVYVTYSGDVKYNIANASDILTISKATANINIDNKEINIGDKVNYEITVQNTYTGDVTISIGDISRTINVENGIAIIELDTSNLVADKYLVKITYANDKNYTNAENAALLKVNKLPSEINVFVNSINVGDNAEIIVTISDEATGNVVIKLGDFTYLVEIIDSKAKLNINDLAEGTYSVIAKYLGDNKFLASDEDSTIFTVSKLSSYLMNASSNDIIEGQNANVIVNLPSDTKGDVKITVNNREYTGTINNGIVRFEISDLTMGSYDVAISYDGDNKYAPISNTTKINVEPRKNISINVNDTTIPITGGNLTAILVDENNNPIQNLNVNVLVDNANKEFETDSNGKITIPLNDLTEGNHRISIKFNGNEAYNSVNTTVKVTVNRLNVKLITEDLFMNYGDGSKFKVRLIDLDGNPIKGETITLALNGGIYTNITNDEGYIEFTVKDKAGIYAAVSSYGGSEIYNPVSNESKIDIKVPIKLTENKDITMYYNDGTVYKVRLIGEYDKALYGQIVKITINGVIYKVKTDNKGYAKLKVNLVPKTYRVTGEYQGIKVFNKLVVKQVLSASSKTVKKGKSFKYTAKLIDKKKKPVSGKIISFKFKGKTYKAKTNSKGIASVTLKSKSLGKSTIVVKYIKDSIKKTIKTKK